MTNSCAEDVASSGNPAEALALAAVPDNGLTIKVERTSPNVTSFGADTPHAGAHPLDDQVRTPVVAPSGIQVPF